jgi:hypothetical protein
MEVTETLAKLEIAWASAPGARGLAELISVSHWLGEGLKIDVVAALRR